MCTPSPDRLRLQLLPSSEVLAAVDSHHRPPIAPTDPLASFPSPCSCSPAFKRRRISAGAPLPMIAARRRPLLAVEHPFPTLLDPNRPYLELPHTALKLPDLSLEAQDHRSAAPAVHLHRWPPAPVAPPLQAVPPQSRASTGVH
jgi:hypothetical protein